MDSGNPAEHAPSRFVALLERQSFSANRDYRESISLPVSYLREKFCVTSFAGGFNRLVVPIFVTGLTSHIFMSIIKSESGIHIMLKEQVAAGPTIGGMTFLAF
jgi:hypothetical protein